MRRRISGKMSMPHLESYWQSELTEAQEWCRFFMQSQVNVLSYSYGALIAVLTLWWSQVDNLQSLDSAWAAVAASVVSAAFAALVMVFAFAESVTRTWGNSVGNHMKRWELAARRLGGDTAYAESRQALGSRPVPGGRMHQSSFAVRVLVGAGLVATCALSLGWPILAAATILDSSTVWAVLLTALPSAASVAFVPIIYIRRHVHAISRFASVRSIALVAEGNPLLARIGYGVIWHLLAVHLLFLILTIAAVVL